MKTSTKDSSSLDLRYNLRKDNTTLRARIRPYKDRIQIKDIKNKR